MNEIPVYKAERDAGIAQLIQSNASLSYICTAKASKPSDEAKKTILTLPAIQNFVKAANENQIDLFYMNDIMVSCGWNGNDDVFLKEEVWPARASSVDKPFNFEHSPREIIGHITDQIAINTKGEVIPSDTSLDEVPEDFDILTNTVIYRFYNDAEYKKKIDGIIEEITTSDKWKVSMEALFSNYDYALQDGEDVVIIARDSKTASLSQHLKAYKGSGEYKGKKLGRVLKNITFCGKGLTDNPANERSLIKGTQPFTTKANKNNSTVFNLGYTNLNEGDNKMNEQEFKAKIAELETVLATSKAQAEKEKAELEVSLTKANESLVTVAAKVAELEKVSSETKVSLDAKIVELKDINEKFTKASQDLAKIDAENRKNARINTMVEDLKMAKESAVELYETLASLQDEQFASYVEKSKKLLTVKVEETPVVTAEKVIETAIADKVETPVVVAETNVTKTKDNIKNFLKASKGVSKQGDK